MAMHLWRQNAKGAKKQAIQDQHEADEAGISQKKN